jgi:arylsulfatase A-like enzyme
MNHPLGARGGRSLAACFGVLGLILSQGSAALARQDPPPRRPNVLFLFTDDQRADTIHALGNPTIETPNLDLLARSGLSFRNAYCMGGDVGAVCLPSRLMLLSGRSLFRVRPVPPDASTFPKTMAAAGYETYHHGKRGNTAQEIQTAFATNKYLSNDQQERRSGYPGKEIADDAIAFLKERSRDKPFFMYLAFGNPHDPRVANPDDRKRYDEAKIPVPANFRPLHPFNNGELTIRDEALLPWPRTPEAVREELADYYAVITHLDRQIGRILQALKEAGDSDNTLIVFSSDQGLAMGSHGLMGKQNLYEDGMKVPLIVTGPGVSPGRTDAFVYLFDLLPTVCDLVGASMPTGISGRSFAPVIRGQSNTHRDTIFLAYRDVQRAVRRGDWKLIRYPRINRTQLFDLKTDPHEIHDLSGDPEQAGRIEDLMGLLLRQQREFGDSLPLTSPNPEPAEIDPAIFRRVKR